MSFPTHAVTKSLPLKFDGVSLTLKASHALFSSHKIDDGTLLLLKTLVHQKAVPDQGRLLDVGCGTGPLVLALKKRHPGLEAHAQDRSALACAFSAENGRVHGLDVKVSASLMLEDAAGPWDLVVSNIPAKAGAPVLEDFFARSAAMLSPRGRAAVVIVHTLADFALSCLEKFQIPLVYQEKGKNYSVFHYAAAGEAQADPFPDTYLRSSQVWNVGKRQGGLDGFWGLANFDSFDYQIQVAQNLWEAHRWKPGRSLVWEPGQGHWATALAELASQEEPLVLASPDVLALKASAHNLELWGFEGTQSHPVTHIGDLKTLEAQGSFQNLFVAVHSEPEVPWTEGTLDTLRHLACAGAQVLVSGTSTDLARFLDHHKGFRLLKDSRYRGWRAVILERLE